MTPGPACVTIRTTVLTSATSETCSMPKKRQLQTTILTDFDNMTAEQQQGFLRLAGRYAVRALLRIIAAASPASSSNTDSGSTPNSATRSSRD